MNKTLSPIPTIPPDNFLLGNTLRFQRDSLGFITQAANEYGPVVRFRLANVRFYFITHPDGVQRVLHDNQRNYLKGDFFNILRVVAGEGLITSEGEHWLSQRRLMQPAFHRQRIAGFAQMIARRASEMLDRWELVIHNGQPINLAQEMTELTMGIISEAMFSAQFQDEDHAASGAIAYLLEDLKFRFTIPYYPGIKIPTLRNLHTRRALRALDQVIYGIIRERRKQGKEADDLLGMLMSARDEETGQVMSDLHLRDEAVGMFIAGHETTALALSWLFYLLSQNPEAAERMNGEAAALGGREVELADLAGLTYTRQAIDEALRLYPPAWITNRTSVEEDEISGFHIPAGSVVGISPYATQRLPEFWPDPERFSPDRFAPENSSSRPRFAYFPFGGGPHQCIGKDFALLEATLIAASIAQRCRLELAPGRPVIPQPTVTLRPKEGVWMKVGKA